MKKEFLVTILILFQSILNAQIENKKIIADCKFDYNSSNKNISTFINMPLYEKKISYLVSPSIGMSIYKNTILGFNLEYNYNYLRSEFYKIQVVIPTVVGVDGTNKTDISKYYSYDISRDFFTGIFLKYQNQFSKKLLIGASSILHFGNVSQGIFKYSIDKKSLHNNKEYYIKFAIEPEIGYMVNSNFAIKVLYSLFTSKNEISFENNSLYSFVLFPKNLNFGITYYFNFKKETK